ncbi:uncharacterized protein [Magallana gigas]|uniref:uncharacterized protein n=1 Tax=Magallana gigas TaxID=29159 RepID=UPI00333F761D
MKKIFYAPGGFFFYKINFIFICRKSSSELSLPSVLESDQDDYTESEEEEFGAREDDTHSPGPKINWAVNLDDDNYSEEDDTFEHPPPGAREEDTHSPASKINWAVNLNDDNYSEEDETFVHPPPILHSPPYIEMQYKKFYQRHRKTSFKPLIPGLLGQEDVSPSNTRRNSLRNRRVAPEPILTTDAVVSAGPKDREYIEENFNIPTDSDTPIQGTTTLKENRRGSTPSNEDPSSSPGSPAPTEDTRENGVQSPVDPNHFTTRLAWKSDVDEENCEEQSEV